MGLFSMNYDKPGKGVDENAPEKRGFFQFWDIYFRKFSRFVRANLLYVVTLIPTFLIIFFLVGIISSSILSADGIQNFLMQSAEQSANDLGDAAMAQEYFMQTLGLLDVILRFVLSFLYVILWGAGPATAGMTFIMRNYANEQHAWIFSDFKDAVKENWKQSLAVFLIDIIVFILFFVAIRVYSGMDGIMRSLQYVIWVFGVVYTMMHFYIYPMMVTFRLSLKDLYRNALLFAIGALPSNVLALFLVLLVNIGPAYLALRFAGDYLILVLFVLAILQVVMFLSFSCFIVNFNTYPKMKKYMLNVVKEKEEA